MKSEKEIIAHRSVIELPQWIEKVFTGHADYPSALEKLLNSFTPDFRMVTMAGQDIGFAGVENLFSNNIGARPQLRINIDACETLAESAESVICRYRETQHNEGTSLIRWSLVIIDIHEGKPLWRYLHETAIVE
ncbi:hypothetical protein [Xenorhabdus szentirmaii]|uniref:DUF4440 domain-containing protein n=2 Tax=Xenorhabdus szentirmaii TaxID=290112 RepID=W1J4B4_9GAMM|nr:MULTISPECIES: hypothetical protein [Xenorhabdus]MBD2782186.1 hypothetical protein [Xenorhabdus sp. 38]MBD2793814.1 hypothetical protein [Xenorhabdus sp. CUL]MBD2801113.1 hypothetical protein [Xenorhabdus sp. M]MBD2805529.1 hypothetical protein [Xenorhabdus sp. ZM]MBD2821681.1 hypothetical protein [Xenorhabdus sp. 42]